MSDIKQKALAAQAELKRAADAAFAEYRCVEASAGVEHKRVIEAPRIFKDFDR
jgi:hypothetical protein